MRVKPPITLSKFTLNYNNNIWQTKFASTESFNCKGGGSIIVMGNHGPNNSCIPVDGLVKFNKYYTNTARANRHVANCGLALPLHMYDL